MSTKKCEVIKDLLPLYIDNICSGESRRMVSEHLESCNECKTMYENICNPVEQSLSGPELYSKQALKVINRKWRMKKISIMCVSIMLTAIVIITIGYIVLHDKIYF